MQIRMELKSDALPGSGEGLAGIIDADINYDDFGIPYIPAKRLKGILRESAQELVNCNILHLEKFNTIFGGQGTQWGTELKISDGRLENYSHYQRLFDFISYEENPTTVFNKETALEQFTYFRSQTAIENGIADKNSLRTSRVLKKGLIFYFDIELPNNTSGCKDDFEKICKVTRRFGLKRTRGLGEIQLDLFEKSQMKEKDRKFSFENLNLSDDDICCLVLQIKNSGQLLVTSEIGKSQYSGNYIPGSVILGTFANAYISEYLNSRQGDKKNTTAHQDKEFSDFFLKSKVIFSNAYPWIEDQQAPMPAPVSIVKEKDKNNYFDFAFPPDQDQIANSHQIEIERKVGDFITISGTDFKQFSVDTEVEYHHRRPEDKRIGHATKTEGEFFQFSTIKPGQSFRAEIIGPLPLLKKISGIIEKIQVFYMGKSRTAQYGKTMVRVKECRKLWAPPGKWQPGDRIIITLISDMVLRNQNGLVTPDPEILKEEIANKLNIDKENLIIKEKFLKFVRKGGFLGTWKMPRIRYHALGVGSVLVIEKKSTIPNDNGHNTDILEKHAFGIEIGEGNGRIMVNWHGKQHLNRKVYKPEPPPLPTKEAKKLKAFIQSLLLNRIESRLKKLAIENAQQLKKDKKLKSISGSFLEKVSMFIKAAQTFSHFNDNYLAKMKGKSKSNFEQPYFKEHLQIVTQNQENKPLMKVDIRGFGNFVENQRQHYEIDSSHLDLVLADARIPWDFFKEETILFELYQKYALTFLRTLNLLKRGQND